MGGSRTSSTIIVSVYATYPLPCDFADEMPERLAYTSGLVFNHQAMSRVLGTECTNGVSIILINPRWISNFVHTI